MDIVTWLIVGLVAGVIAALIVGGSGYGLIGDVVVGMVGAVAGSWLFGEMGWRAPLAGIGGTIFVASVGSLLLLVALHVVQRRRPVA